MFKAFTLNGLNLEATHLSKIERIDKLVAPIGIAFVWAYNVAELPITYYCSGANSAVTPAGRCKSAALLSKFAVLCNHIASMFLCFAALLFANAHLWLQLLGSLQYIATLLFVILSLCIHIVVLVLHIAALVTHISPF